jgi:hypothetical protein
MSPPTRQAAAIAIANVTPLCETLAYLAVTTLAIMTVWFLIVPIIAPISPTVSF